MGGMILSVPLKDELTVGKARGRKSSYENFKQDKIDIGITH